MGATSSNMMALASGVQAVSAINTARNEGAATKLQAEYENFRLNQNAKLTERQAKEAIDQGQKGANKITREANQIKGAQRVAAAASGLKVGAGSYADLLAETDAMAAIDIMTLKNNAFKEAWGLKTQALDYRTQGKIGVTAAKYTARQYMLTGGLQALNSASQGAAYYQKGKEKKQVSADFSDDPTVITPKGEFGGLYVNSKTKYKDPDGYYSGTGPRKKRGY